MAVELIIPKWGLSMQEGEIIQWLKGEGEEVREGEELLEISSDKITNVVEAPASGILHIVYPEGAELPIQTVIGFILQPGEPIPDTGPAGKRENGGRPDGQSRPNGSARARPVEQVEQKITAARDTGRIRAMPAARRMAEMHQIDLSTIEGSGPRGAITKQDVERAIARQKAPAPDGIVRAMPAARALARARGIALAGIQGTGPNGAITKQDVERAIQAASPTLRPTRRVTFYSEGLRLDGMLYSPEGLTENERRPALLLCVGYTYIKELVMPDIARALNEVGYVAMIFDYRGFGRSEGARGRLIPEEQLADVRAALTFLAAQPHVDPSRLGLVGLSLGGAHAIMAAAMDERVAAAVAIEAPGDGRRWLRSLRRYHEWEAFTARIERDRTQRVMSGDSEQVDPLEIVLPDPGSRAFLEAVYREFPAMQCQLSLESAERLMEYCPESVACRIAPRPLLLIHGEEDLLVPAEESRRIYDAAGHPKELQLLPGLDHFNWVMADEPAFKEVTGRIVGFLSTHLPLP